jgi:hypothetical protein
VYAEKHNASMVLALGLHRILSGMTCSQSERLMNILTFISVNRKTSAAQGAANVA